MAVSDEVVESVSSSKFHAEPVKYKHENTINDNCKANIWLTGVKSTYIYYLLTPPPNLKFNITYRIESLIYLKNNK